MSENKRIFLFSPNMSDEGYEREYVNEAFDTNWIAPLIYQDATPVFIDCNLKTWNMDPDALEEAFEQYPDPFGAYGAFLELSKDCGNSLWMM